MDVSELVIQQLAIVIAASALLAWVAVVAKQPMIVAYILCGVLLGPYGFGLIEKPEFLRGISELGVMLLLFLAGVVLHPDRLLKLFRRTTPVALVNCIGSFLLAFFLAAIWVGWTDAAYVGLACMFSSTILVIKLLPTTTLHQERMGSLAIGVLILQDLIAVMVLIIMRAAAAANALAGVGHGPSGLPQILQQNLDWPGAAILAMVIVTGLVLTVLALVFEQHVLRRMMRRIDHFDEGIYLLALGWCIGNAALWKWCGLSQGVGAFVAGVALARSPISLFLSEGLKLLRDFFLVLFFFTLGAQLDLRLLRTMALPACVIAAVLMAIKPLLFDRLFRWTGETKRISTELSIRLGQLSEFGLIIAMLGEYTGNVTHHAAQLIQFAIILTLAVSAYIVVLKYPTPIGARGALHKD